MMTDQSKGTTLITGASSDVGATYANGLAHRGHDLVLAARDEARLAAIAAELNQKTGVAIDLLPADPAQWEAFAATRMAMLPNFRQVHAAGCYHA